MSFRKQNINKFPIVCMFLFLKYRLDRVTPLLKTCNNLHDMAYKEFSNLAPIYFSRLLLSLCVSCVLTTWYCVSQMCHATLFLSIFFKLPSFWNVPPLFYLVSSLSFKTFVKRCSIHSFNMFVSIYCASGTVLGAGDSARN